MLSFSSELKQVMNALDKSQAVIHFDTNGTILWANPNFLGALGYSLDEIKGKHHRMFVDPNYAETADYHKFWDDLRAGKFQAAQYRRFGKGNREIWIQATYNPILNKAGKPVKVVKFATDITNSVVKTKEAFDRVQALIYFNMDGTIKDANDNFLKCTGYSIDEIRGRHHSMFCDPEYVKSAEYKNFWGALNRGDLQTGEFHRFGKGNREIWLQASYTVRYDNEGNPAEVVKYATDITQHKQNRMETNQAIGQVSSATQELTNAITDISRSTSVAKGSAETMQSQTNTADASMNRLLESAKAMGAVLELIQDISDQINLLALNAAIEAARAGDLGRGFAVVADEVKRLASQAGQSSAQIAGEVNNIQSISGEVAKALQQIKSSVNEVTETTNTVAAAVEQQSAVTKGISNNMVKVNNLINA